MITIGLPASLSLFFVDICEKKNNSICEESLCSIKFSLLVGLSFQSMLSSSAEFKEGTAVYATNESNLRLNNYRIFIPAYRLMPPAASTLMLKFNVFAD